jgi:CRISPR-associated protein Cmr4
MTDTGSLSDGVESRLYWIHALTPLHVGAGRGIGFIDLPIVREAVTAWPYVPGSAVKGVVADHHHASRDEDRNPDSAKLDQAAADEAKLRKMAFGRAGSEASNSGSLVFTDAHLVCLPVRSLYGTFAWCTCPMALERLRRDLGAARMGSGMPRVELTAGSAGALSVHVPVGPASVLADRERIYLEDLDFESAPSESASAWAEALAMWAFTDDATWQTIFRQRFAVLPDDAFNFLCETAMQVDARVKIDDDTKTVADGQLWYEESLPAETLLAGIVWCGPVFGNGNRNDPLMRAKILDAFARGVSRLQMGGKATVGRGRVDLSFVHSATASSIPSRA